MSKFRLLPGVSISQNRGSHRLPTQRAEASNSTCRTRLETSPLVAVAVAVTVDVACGLDVESLDSVDDPLLIAATAMSAYERGDLANQPDPRHRFLEYWTHEEAYLKARGAFLRLTLDRFGFVFDPEPPPMRRTADRRRPLVMAVRYAPTAWQYDDSCPDRLSVPRHHLSLTPK